MKIYMITSINMINAVITMNMSIVIISMNITNISPMIIIKKITKNMMSMITAPPIINN